MRSKLRLETRIESVFGEFFLTSDALTKRYHRATKKYERVYQIYQRERRQQTRARKLRQQYGGKSWKA